MTKNTDVILELLDEIDDICNRENLSYFLSGNALKQANETGTFADRIAVAEVLMPLNDIFVLQKYAEAAPNRTMESIFSNQNFRYFFFKYVADDTTYFNKRMDRSSNACGIHIRIRALKQDPNTKESKQASKMKRFWVRYHNSYPYPWIIKGFSGKKIKRRIGKAYIDANYDKYYKKMLDKIVHSQKDFDFNGVNYINYRKYGKGYKNRICFPEGLFSEYCLVELEGHRYRTVKDIETLLYITYMAEDVHEGIELIQSTQVPYREYMEYLKTKGLTTDISKVVSDETKAQSKFKKADTTVAAAWRNMQRSVLKKKLEPQIGVIRDTVLDCYRHNKWDELGLILEEFDILSREYAKQRITLNFDEDVMEAYLSWLVYNQEDSFARTIQRIIKQEEDEEE